MDAEPEAGTPVTHAPAEPEADTPVTHALQAYIDGLGDQLPGGVHLKLSEFALKVHRALRAKHGSAADFDTDDDEEEGNNSTDSDSVGSNGAWRRIRDHLDETSWTDGDLRLAPPAPIARRIVDLVFGASPEAYKHVCIRSYVYREVSRWWGGESDDGFTVDDHEEHVAERREFYYGDVLQHSLLTFADVLKIAYDDARVLVLSPPAYERTEWLDRNKLEILPTTYSSTLGAVFPTHNECVQAGRCGDYFAKPRDPNTPPSGFGVPIDDPLLAVRGLSEETPIVVTPQVVEMALRIHCAATRRQAREDAAPGTYPLTSRAQVSPYRRDFHASRPMDTADDADDENDEDDDEYDPRVSAVGQRRGV